MRLAICFALISGLLTAQGGIPLRLEYQLNTPAASIDVNGVVVTSPAGPPARVFTPVLAKSVFNAASTNVGMPFEIAFTPWPVLSVTDGGLVTRGGQVLHISPFWPDTVFWSTGGPTTTPMAFPGNFSVPFTSPYPVLVSAQMVVFDPMIPDMFCLSQGTQVEFLIF